MNGKPHPRPGITAELVYAALVFLVGLGFGTIRVTLIAPHLGETDAVLLEAPIMLAVSWKACRWSAARWRVPADAAVRILMGSIAFAILMLAELGVSALVFGRSVSQHFGSYRSIAGAIGLAAQLAFAVFPWLQTRRIEAQ